MNVSYAVRLPGLGRWSVLGVCRRVGLSTVSIKSVRQGGLPWPAPVRWLAWASLGLGLAIAITGCEDERIRAYRAPKPPRAVTGPPTGPTARAETERQMVWDVPHGWHRLPEDRPMRRVTFEAGHGDRRIEIQVSAFPGETGGVHANVNRWRTQIGLDKIEPAHLNGLIESFANQTLHGFTVDMTGPTPPAGGGPTRRMVAAIIHGDGGMTWFVKAVDQAPVMATHKDAIFEFARSFRLGPPAPPSAAAANITWQTPRHWRADRDPSSTMFAYAVFHIGNGPKTVKVTVTPLVGDGGGRLANVNRWRDQVGLGRLGSLADQTLTRLEVAGSLATVVDLVSPPGPPVPPPGPPPERQRLLVAMLVRPQRTWFIKMTGPAQAVENQKPAFLEFVGSIRFGAAAPPASGPGSGAGSAPDAGGGFTGKSGGER